MIKFNIKPVDRSLIGNIQKKIDLKTKPQGSLGMLESIALQVSLVQQTLTPKLTNPHIVIFAGDHGIANEGVSAFPQEVTYQMVYNFLNKGAAINVFSNQNNIELKIVDAGVNYDFGSLPTLINSKIGFGTKSFLSHAAMSRKEFDFAVEQGAETVRNIQGQDCNIIGFGEMGIGNTSSASLIMSHICNIPLTECIGKGTGVDEAGLKHKVSILEQAKSQHNITSNNSEEVLRTFGGFEIVMMYGAILQASELDMMILIDGFIATSAFLAAFNDCPNVKDYTVFSHCSDETGHMLMLDYLNANSVLNLGLRLGEGTGCALSYPLVQSAITMMNNMASFETARVTDKRDT